jgi:hypothetical protein
MRGSRGSLLARSRRESEKSSSRSGRHFGIGRLSAIGNGRPPKCRDSLELAEARFRRRRALLRVPRDRLFRRRAVRSGLPVVQGPIPAATLAGPGTAHHAEIVGEGFGLSLFVGGQRSALPFFISDNALLQFFGYIRHLPLRKRILLRQISEFPDVPDVMRGNLW